MAENKNKPVKSVLRGPIFYILLVVSLLVLGFGLFFNNGSKEISTAKGLSFLTDDKVKKAEITDGDQKVTLTLVKKDEKYGDKVHFYYVAPRGLEVVEAINKADIESFNDKVPQPNPFWSFVGFIFPILIIGLIFWWMISSMQGGGSKIMQFGKSRAKLFSKENPQVTFKDVAGAEEAIEELHEIKDFLKNADKFLSVGAKIPKGVLLYGPPGTGKTLLARAVAGEAGVPFYSISGSDFVEMFVGVGASRVRDLFQKAKESAPAIVFIDEIDAVGQRRGQGIGGGHDEREQTLNQLLVEMDGFDIKTNVILIAATNRPDVLDPALLRPGRFDRQIGVDAPDMKGRQKILEVHAKGKPLGEDADLEVVARKTPGFTGADLANVLNEAALLTARFDRKIIDAAALDEAIDRVMAGPQRRTRIMNDKERLITAYHEAGHALVAASMRNSDPVTKITILPRGRALGYTMVMPLNDKYSVTRNELLDQIAYAMGGRVAEEVVFHDPTTGAYNDIEKATSIARKMVTDYGMTAEIGPVKLGSSGGSSGYLGDLSNSRDFSENVAFSVDKEVRKIIENAHNEAWQALNMNRDILDNLSKELLEKETLDHKQIEVIFSDVKKIPERDVWLSSEQRPVSDIPPVDVPDRLKNEFEDLPEDKASEASASNNNEEKSPEDNI